MLVSDIGSLLNKRYRLILEPFILESDTAPKRAIKSAKVQGKVSMTSLGKLVAVDSLNEGVT